VYTFGLTLLAQDQLLSGVWTVRYHGLDGHGNTRYLTDALGDITDTYDYDAFGNLNAATGSTPNNFLFTSEQLDPDLGLYFLRARYQDTTTGRFWTMDEFDGIPGDPMSLHKYLYASSDPVNHTDPSGYWSLKDLAISMGIGAILHAALNYDHNQPLSAVAHNLFIGALTGAVGYGVGTGIMKAAVAAIRFVKLQRLGGPISRVFQQVSNAQRPIPGTSLYQQFVFRTQAGEVLVSSGTSGGVVTGALKHIVNDILAKAGGNAATTQLAEALALRELEGAIVMAIQSGIRAGQTVGVRTAYAEWELIFEYTAQGALKLFHAVPRLL
jgi:RHS repeat-associated protein